MGSSKTDQSTRQGIRKKLRKWGMAEDEIDKCMIQVRQRQIAKRRREIPLDAPLCTRAEYKRLLLLHKPKEDQSAGILKLGEGYQPLDDKGYKPTYVDPVLTGAARATGKTAKAVKKKTSFVKEYDYDKEER